MGSKIYKISSFIFILLCLSLIIGNATVKSNNEYSSLLERDEIVPDIIKNVSPSVVAIIGNYIPEKLPEHLAPYNVRTYHGTGVVIKQMGEILTNTHVVKDLDNITVVLNDGSSVSAKIKYMDEMSDLAIIKVERNNLVPIKFGNTQDIVPGKTVIALGTPLSFSLRNSASLGIISGLNRGIESEYRLIQTDTAINPGNSGGPLLNLKGELIGINSMKYTGIGIEGMGFSIPVDTVQYVINNFDSYSKVMRPITGMTFEESWEARNGLPTNTGITVKNVENNMPAARAGIQPGDILFKVNNNEVHSIVDFNEIMKNIVMGDQFTVQVKRNSQVVDIIVKPNF